ncbi:methionine--tRNA ligase [Candidatus Woesearchaeota archaeon]|nr:methionine--tRNA ligase [Candidatus Woesearchaeota archaeon]
MIKNNKQIEEGTFKYLELSKKKMKKKFYITTPIYYVNDKPHVGHAYTTIIADILARWHRLKQEDVFFLTGLDENGQKTVEASIKFGFKSPQAWCDYIAEEYLKTWKNLNISNDDFIRTTEERHHKLSIEFTKKVQKKGDIYKGNYIGLYCEGCEAYITESELTKEGFCPNHNKKPKELHEENYFFKLSKYDKQLLEHIENNPSFIQPEFRKKEIINFIKQGLKDISISRQSLTWGIPFPGDESQRIYVWFDALLNYLHPKEYWPANIQMMGKEIIKFHCIIWPAMLLSAGYKLPKKVFAHGWLTINGEKMSKSLGNAIDPNHLTKTFGTDALRYYYAREVPLGNDGDFSEKQLVARLNNELANELGNLISRTLTLIEKKLNSEIKKDKVDKTLFKDLKVKQIDKFIQDIEPHNAIALIFHFIHSCNQYISEKEPWNINKENELNKILYNLTDAIRIISILLYSFLPETCEKIHKQLSLDTKKLSLAQAIPGILTTTKINKGEILFQKVIFKETKDVFKNPKCYVTPEVQRLGIKVKFAELINLNIKKKHMGLEKLKSEIKKSFKPNIRVLKGYDNYSRLLNIEEGQCSVYNLMDLVEENGKLPTINTAVDSYNIISLAKSLVVGAHDREHVKGPVRFDIFKGNELYIPLFTNEKKSVNKGEFGCIDDEKVLCRLDIKQGDQTKVTEKTKNIILYVQGNEYTSEEYLQEAIEEICKLMIRFCDGEYKILN